MKTSIFIVAIFTCFIAAGCSTTTYLSLTENSKEQIEEQLKYDEKDENVGVEVTLIMNNGFKINGELLSVRDTTIIIYSIYGLQENQLARLNYPIYNIHNREIKELTIEGSSYVWTGFFIGIAAGTAIGLVVGSSAEEKEGGMFEGLPTFAGGSLGSLVGATTGSIIGYNLSSEEFVLQEIPPGYDLSILKPLARYQDEEPEYLRAIE